MVRAAEALNLSPSGVGRAVARLEAGLSRLRLARIDDEMLESVGGHAHQRGQSGCKTLFRHVGDHVMGGGILIDVSLAIEAAQLAVLARLVFDNIELVGGVLAFRRVVADAVGVATSTGGWVETLSNRRCR